MSFKLEMNPYQNCTFPSFCQETLTEGHDKALDICKVDYFRTNELRLSGHRARPGLAGGLRYSVTHRENHDIIAYNQILAR